MKTRKDHLMALPSPYAEMAITEVLKEDKRNGTNLLNSRFCLDTPSAMNGGFLWHKSEMGYDFWRGIYEDAKFHKTKAK